MTLSKYIFFETKKTQICFAVKHVSKIISTISKFIKTANSLGWTFRSFSEGLISVG